MASTRPETPPSVSDLKDDGSPSTKHPEEVANTPDAAPTPPSPPEGNKAKKILLLVSVFLCMFLVSLDRTIISTAIPAISNEFNSLNDVGWYGSAYLLTSCAFQLLFGKIYTVFPTRPALLASVFLFEAGSAICGAAPSSVAFTVGRAICGIGAAGLFSGTIVCIVYIVPLSQRPKIQGAFGALFGIASIVGPLLGGAFTSNVTWRWCFYINLPIGGVAMLVIALFLEAPPRDDAKLPLGKKILKLDLLGTSLLIPGVVCLLLALQWGGPKYPWNNPRIIAMLTLAGVLLIGYAVVQATLTSTATIPPRLVKQRSVISALWATIFINSGSYIFIYFLPIWFQAIQHASPVSSGIRLLPVMLATVVGSIFGGFLNTKIGYYTPLAIFGSCLAAVGAGLLTTLHVGAPAGHWIGYQVVYGFGLGTSFQAPNLAVQTALPPKDVPMGIALVFFGQLVGSTVFVSVGQNVFSNQLVKRLDGFPGFDAGLVTEGGATALVEALPEGVRAAAVVKYNEALRQVFLVGLIVTCLAVLGTATLEWLSVKKPQEGKQGGLETGEGAKGVADKGVEGKEEEGKGLNEKTVDGKEGGQ